MKKIIYLVLFCLSFATFGFAAEENGRGWGPHGEWDLDNPCLYHTRFTPNHNAQAQELSYKELLVAAKEHTHILAEQLTKDFQLVDKVILLFSKPLWQHLGTEGYTKLPLAQRLDFTDEEFREYKRAVPRLKATFSQQLSYGLLGLQQTELGRRETSHRFNPLMHELDFALTILQVNSQSYIGSLT